MKHLKALTPYIPDEPVLGLNVIYLRDEDGGDWYEQQKDFHGDTLKVAYDARGIVVSISSDVSRLWPVNLSVVELSADNAPEGLTDSGEWVFNGETIEARTYTQQEYEVQAQQKKDELIAYANEVTRAWQTQLMLGMITDDDKARLTAWMEYIQRVQAIDVSAAPNINWPDKPE